MRLVPGGDLDLLAVDRQLRHGRVAPDAGASNSLAELLDVADVRADGAVVEGADRACPRRAWRRRGSCPGPPCGPCPRRSGAPSCRSSRCDSRQGVHWPQRLVGVEARHDHERLGDATRSRPSRSRRPSRSWCPRCLSPSTSIVTSISSAVRIGAEEPPGTTALSRRPFAGCRPRARRSAARSVIADRRLDDAGRRHVARHRVEPRAALGLGAEARRTTRRRG